MSRKSGKKGDAPTGLAAHPDIVKLRAALESHHPVGADNKDGIRRAAVALLIRAGDNGAPELLFLKRSEYPADPSRGNRRALPGKMSIVRARPWRPASARESSGGNC